MTLNMKKSTVIAVLAVMASALMIVACNGNTSSVSSSNSIPLKEFLDLLKESKETSVLGPEGLDRMLQMQSKVNAFKEKYEDASIPLATSAIVPFNSENGLTIGESELMQNKQSFTARLIAKETIKIEDLEAIQDRLAVVGMNGETPVVAIQVEFWRGEIVSDDEVDAVGDEDEEDEEENVTEGSFVNMDIVLELDDYVFDIDHFRLVTTGDEEFKNAPHQQRRPRY